MRGILRLLLRDRYDELNLSYGDRLAIYPNHSHHCDLLVGLSPLYQEFGFLCVNENEMFRGIFLALVGKSFRFSLAL